MSLVPPVYALIAVALVGVTVTGIGIVAALGYFVVYKAHLWRLSVPIGFLGLFTAAAAWNVIRASFQSFFGSPHFEPAIWLNMNREPRLRQFVESICHGVGSKFPDAIVLHIGPEFFVLQGELSALNATPRGRILAVSLPLLSVMKVGELRAILAHEFAHFTGGDTLYSSIAMRVYASAGHSAAILFYMWKESGWLIKVLMALPLLPAAGVLFAYTWIFHRINMSLSRTREFRADFIAAKFAGRKYMQSGLRKTCGYSGVLGEAFEEKLKESSEQPLPNDSPYRLLRKSIPAYHTLAAKAADEYIATEAAEGGDSHPTVRNRLAALPDEPGVAAQGLEASALTLLAELKAYEKMAGDYMLNEYRVRQREAAAADPTPHLR